MNLVKRGALAVGVTVLGIGTLLAPSAAADASGGPVHIQSGTFHLYEKNNYNNNGKDKKAGWAGLTKTDKDLRNNSFDNGKKVDNQTSSVKNYTNRYVDLWQNVGCTGAHTTSYPGTKDPKLSNDAIRDNRLSCVKFR